MSLIADALRKAETSPADFPSPPSPRSFWAYRVLLLVCAGLVLAGLGWITQRHTRHPSEVRLAKTEIVSRKSAGLKLLRSAQGEMSLSGIIQGGGGKSLALINHQVVEEGDQIQGKRVVRVEPDAVQLQDNAGRIKTLKLAD